MQSRSVLVKEQNSIPELGCSGVCLHCVQKRLDDASSAKPI